MLSLAEIILAYGLVFGLKGLVSFNVTGSFSL